MKTTSESLVSPESAFALTLQSFQRGDLTHSELLARVDSQMSAGASAAELKEILVRHESAHRLPRSVHDALLQAMEQSLTSARTAAMPAEAATIILDDVEPGGEPPPPEETARRKSVAVGDVLVERYRLVELIGTGGLSRVYKAIDANGADHRSEDFIAVKVLSRPFVENSWSFSSLQDEVHKLQKLTHPKIVRIFNCLRDGQTVFITMEFLPGESLYTKLREGASAETPRLGLERNEARSIIGAIADALEYAHRHDVVHGDLKPGNVIVSERGEVKIIDFGIASWITRPMTTLERRETGESRIALALTPRYASPQLMARRKPEPADDVYALACLTYELLTGSHPFEAGMATSAAEFPPPLRPGLTSSQYAAVVHGLQRERENRTPTVRQFMEEFGTREPRNPWIARGLWTSAALLALLVGWFYGHRPPAPAAPSPPVLEAARPAPAGQPAKPGSIIRDCPTCPLMTVLPTGHFRQGTAAGGGRSPFEQPQHIVAIDYPLAMSANDVTVGDFHDFVVATNRDMQGCDVYDGVWRYQAKASWSSPGFPQTNLHPVTCTSWNDAVAYAQWLSAKTAHRYRLPSASEWEYAARAGGDATQPWDSSQGVCANANVADQTAAHRYPGWEAFACDDGYVYTAPVGSFKANAFGLNDMLGNVFQWTQDCWHADYANAPINGSARVDGDCIERELRGGSWFSSPSYVRASYRNHFAAGYRTGSVGFRLVRELGP